MPSTDTKPELTAKASMAQPVSQPAVYANGLILFTSWTCENYTELYYDMLKEYLFPTKSPLLSIVSFTFEKEHVFPPGKNCFIMFF
jgi:hypothetical protein